MQKVFIDFSTKYVCMLDGGCGGTSHSVHCERVNARYAEIQIEQERVLRRNVVRAAGVQEV